MKHYVITQAFTRRENGKEYRKDQTITDADVGQANIDHYLKKGYIRLLGDDSGRKKELPFYMTVPDFLTPEQVDDLTKAELIEYAGRIALTGFKPNVSVKDLKALINGFIADATEDDDDPGEDDEDGAGDGEDGNADDESPE